MELRRGRQPYPTQNAFRGCDCNGSLRSVTDLRGITYRFRYDAFGRRLEKRRMASTFRFVWDGNVLLHEPLSVTTPKTPSLLLGYSRVCAYHQVGEWQGLWYHLRPSRYAHTCC